MPDYSQYGIPRPVELGREVRMEQRRATNRAAIFAIAGVLVLCVCLCVGLAGAYYALNSEPGATAFALPFGGSTATPTPAEATPVPFLKSVKNDSGLRATVTAFQRPLPAQGVDIPRGQELALVSVRLENTRTTGGPIKYSPEDFKLVTPEGESYAPDTQGLTTGETLKPGEIAPGKSVKGDLIYYIYTDAKDVMLSWDSPDGTTILFKLTRK